MQFFHSGYCLFLPACRTDDVAKLLEMARADGYDFVTTSLPSASSTSSLRTDVTELESKWWSTSVVGSIADPAGPISSDGGGSGADANGESAMSEVGGFSFECIQNGSGLVSALEKELSQSLAVRQVKFMLDWAGHMNVPAAILPAVPLDPEKASAYARLLASLALDCSASNVQLWVRVAATPHALAAYELLHRRCDHPANLGCMLCFDASSSSSITAQNVGQYLVLVHKMVGCNLRAVSFSTRMFLTNKRGYPTLSKSIQMIFTELLRRLGRTLRVLVEGTPYHDLPTQEAAGYSGCLPYLQYLRHIRTRPEITFVLDTDEARMETSYLDHLQSPLQPLGDNLEFQTYETFEKDPVKYERYEDAIFLAVRDGLQNGLYRNGGGVFAVSIMVVGAGRGPLVEASLNAIERINKPRKVPGASIPLVKTSIVAVEKNSSAVIYLRSLQKSEPRSEGCCDRS